MNLEDFVAFPATKNNSFHLPTYYVSSAMIQAQTVDCLTTKYQRFVLNMEATPRELPTIEAEDMTHPPAKRARISQDTRRCTKPDNPQNKVIDVITADHMGIISISLFSEAATTYIRIMEEAKQHDARLAIEIQLFRIIPLVENSYNGKVSTPMSYVPDPIYGTR